METTKKNELERIARLPAGDLTIDDRFFIKVLSEELGVAFTPRTGCPNCYADQALLLYKLANERAAAQEDEREYVLREDVDVIYKGQRVNNSTLTDELAADMIAHGGFSKNYFIKCK